MLKYSKVMYHIHRQSYKLFFIKKERTFF